MEDQMKPNHKFLTFSLIITAWVFIISCGIGMPKIPGLPGGSASTPWADVPAFPGATQNPNEALGTSLFNQAQANEKSKMETVIFHTDKKPPEIAAFYNDEMMKSKGWLFGMDGTDETGCTQDKYEGQPRTMCTFYKKNEEGREIELTIDARDDPNGGNNTRLILVRITGSLVTK
jgi:hypothetical protein